MNHKNLIHYSRSQRADLNSWPPEFETGVLTTRPGRSVFVAPRRMKDADDLRKIQSILNFKYP
jgi:hypothetical protein